MKQKEKTIAERVAERWKLLNSFGVYTQEDLKKFNEKYKLDIGIFTMPINHCKSS